MVTDEFRVRRFARPNRNSIEKARALVAKRRRQGDSRSSEVHRDGALENVQYLAGHSSPRTTWLYDRRQKKVTRNIVERISI